MPIHEILWWNTCSASRIGKELQPLCNAAASKQHKRRGAHERQAILTINHCHLHFSPSSWHGPLLETSNWSSPAWQFLQYLSRELVVAWKGSQSSWQKKHTEKCLDLCALTCRDWPHQAAMGALAVLLGISPLSFLQSLHGSSGQRGLRLHKQMREAQQGIYHLSIFFPKRALD